MHLQLAFALIAIATGLIAAWYWFGSTRVNIDPATSEHDGGRTFHFMKWVESVMGASKSASELNRKAALWTAISVLAGGLSAVFGAWLPN
jgi:hypothetical protein